MTILYASLLEKIRRSVYASLGIGKKLVTELFPLYINFTCKFEQIIKLFEEEKE